MPTNKNIVSVDLKRDTKNKLKVLASFDGQTMVDYAEWLIDKAYEVALHNHQASVRSKKAIGN